MTYVIRNMQVGQTFSITRTVTDELIRRFAELSGDHNPLHLDDDYAASTRFGRRIAHGMLSGAFISAVLGGELADRKIVYLSQTMRFTAPVFIGDTITTTARVKKIVKEKGVVTLDTVCANDRGETTLDGEAVIMLLR